MTVADYMHKLVRPEVKNIAMDVCNMEVFKPLIAKMHNKEPQMIRLTATADTGLDHAELLFSSGRGKSNVDHARCIVKYGDGSAWLAGWQRTAYLIQGRIEGLKNAMKDGRAHRLLRGMVYKLFAALVQYDSKYRGMEEVILDSAELEATAQVAFQTTEADGTFFCSPYWIDSLGHLSGFIVNGSDAVDSANQVYVSHGWQSLRIAKPLSADKKYRTYVKMQPAPGKMVAGDVFIFEGETIIAVFEGLKFQCIPRTILNTFLPPAGIPMPIIQSQKLAKTALQPETSVVVAKSNGKSITSVDRLKTGFSIIDQTLVIIAEEVGVSLDELPDAIEFADLGVDSLMSLSISGRMREEFEINVHSSMFNECPTVGQLKVFLTQFETKIPIKKTSVTEIETYAEVRRDVVVSSGAAVTGVSIIDRTLEIIAEEVGVSIDELPDAIEFADLGVDSLMSLSISGRMREEFEVNLQSSIFIDHPTVGQLKSFLTQFELRAEAEESKSHTDSGLSTPSLDSRMATPRHNGDSTPATPPGEDEISSTDLQAQVVSETDDGTIVKINKAKSVTILGSPPQRNGIRHSSTPHDHLLETLNRRLPGGHSQMPSSPHRSATSVLLQGNSRKSSKTLWLFPDGGGSATSYISIPDLSPEIAVFGLNSPFMKTPEEYDCGVDGITTMFLLELRRRQPKGPYNLAGWSAGGVVAFEAAQQLLRAGEVIEKLILIDSPCPLIIEPLPQSLHQFFNSIGLLGDGLRTENKTPSWLLPHFASSVQALSEYRSKVTKMDPSKAPSTVAIWCEDGVCKLPSDPRPEPYPYGHAQWLLENRTDFGPDQWDTFIPLEKMSMTSIPGNHFTMMREPNVSLFCFSLQIRPLRRSLSLMLISSSPGYPPGRFD